MIFKNDKKGYSTVEVFIAIAILVVLGFIIIKSFSDRVPGLQNAATNKTKDTCAIVVQNGKCDTACTGEYEPYPLATCGNGQQCCKPKERRIETPTTTTTSTTPTAPTTATTTTAAATSSGTFDTSCTGTSSCMQTCPSQYTYYNCPAGKICAYVQNTTLTCTSGVCCTRYEYVDMR